MAWIPVIFCQCTHDSHLRGAVLLTRRRKEPKLSREYLTISPCILAQKPHSIRPSGSRGKGEEAGKCGLFLSIFRYIFLVLDWKDCCYLRSYCSLAVSCTGTHIGTRFPSPEGSVIATVGPRFTLGHQDAIAHILKWACLLVLAAEKAALRCISTASSCVVTVGKQKQELVSSVGFAHVYMSAWCVHMWVGRAELASGILLCWYSSYFDVIS